MTDPIRIKDESQFVVLQDEQHVAVSMAEIQEQVAPRAARPNLIDGKDGIPGLMYPGAGIDYEPASGEISIDIPRIPQFLGVIGDEMGMKQVPSGKEVFDDYYVVGVPGFELPNSWGEISGVTPNINDKVICGDENKGQDRWYIEPDFMGSFAVLEVVPGAATPSLSVDNSDPQRPKLDIVDVEPRIDAANPGISGLMPPDMAQAVQDLDRIYVKRDFASYPGVPDTP